MAKSKIYYLCSECGYESAKWYGKCPSCGAWNTLEEEERTPQAPSSTGSGGVGKASAAAVRIREVDVDSEHRYYTGMGELDRVLGGGIVKGSVVLLGGDPGIGKSTLLLQICEFLGQQHSILYVSGEESVRQIKLRADRLGVTTDRLMLLSETRLEAVISQIYALRPELVIVDSIQTMNSELATSAPGSITQIRACTAALTHAAKEIEMPIVLVGHVNKDGGLAGPKVLEHMVDAVLLFEGDRNMSYRILRAVKNRYGSTNEIGVFEMQQTGLCEVENPSQMLLSGRPKNVSGSCVACVMEGSRPILAEVQGLVTATSFGTPRRMSTGFDYNRMSLLLAVLEKRAGYYFSSQDAFLNVVGGLRLDEPAADLTVALALVSGLKDAPVGEDVIAFGEIGLAGEIRGVSYAIARVREAARLGFRRIILPRHNLKAIHAAGIADVSVTLVGVGNIREAFEASLSE